jgi:hypothetical protein
MKELAAVLDDLVADAPVENSSWTDVLARSRRIRRPSRARKAFVLAFAAILLVALAGTAIGFGISLLKQQDEFHTSRPDDPKRLGPLVEITSDENWALIAWRSEVGICVDFAIPGNSPFGCGFPVRGAKPATDTSGGGPPIHAVAGCVSGSNLVGSDGKMTIFGVAARDVASVKIELRDGEVVEAPLYDAPRELAADVRFFIVRLPPLRREPGSVLRRSSPVKAYNAYGGQGRLIERVEE